MDLTAPLARYLAALSLFTVALLITARMMQKSFGAVLIGIRENEERTRMLGYDVFRHKLAAVIISGVISGAAGATYALLFGYVGEVFLNLIKSIIHHLDRVAADRIHL